MNTITRFAPSPTGKMHIGNLRSALFAWLFAKSTSGQFYIRIEDTDKSREVKGSVDSILETLKWLNLDYDKASFPGSNNRGIVFQSKRLDIYQKYVNQLLNNGCAYICTCSEQKLKNLRKHQIKNKKPPIYDGHCRALNLKMADVKTDYVVRLKMPKQGITQLNDAIRGQIEFKNTLIDDQILLKSDKFPTYHLANVIDDHLMGVTHVIRAEEWLPSAPKHVMLYKYFNWEMPVFVHVPMILGKDKSKLSKRHGAVSAVEYQKVGYLSDAVFNYLSMLGWHAKTNQEIFTRQEIIKKFSLERIQKSPAIFDQEKLSWLNGLYIRATKPQELFNKLVKHGKTYNQKITEFFKLFTNKVQVIRMISLAQQRMKKLNDFLELSEFFVTQPDYDPSLLQFRDTKKHATKNALESVLELFNSLEDKDFVQKILRTKIQNMLESKKMSVGQVLHPLRIALTGLKNSPGPFETAEVLEKKESIHRVQKALEKIEQL